MPLKQIILHGFKSFADRTVLNLAPGITGIVGPNGAGKSNITEAVRWVMGEGSAKALRGQSMQDVIFGGSAKRKPMNHAAVTLVFDNSQKELAWPGSEVNITRRLLKNGEAAYLINGKAVRLKDVRALFLSGNLSAGSLAIISQGRVDQVLDSKPESRRAIFEEAAGVLHFKEQKHEAVGRLKQTNENLVRIHDLLTEVQKRVEPLARQSSTARDYQFEAGKLAVQEKAWLAMEIACGQKKLSQAKASGRSISGQLDRIEQKIADQKAVIARDQQQNQHLQAQQKTLQAENLQLTQKTARLQNKIDLAQQTGSFNQANQQELAGQASTLAASLKQRALTQQQNRQEGWQLQAKIKKLRKQVDERQAQGQAADKIKRDLENERTDYLQHLEQERQISNQIVALQTSLQQSQTHQAQALQEQQAARQHLQQELTKKNQQVQELTETTEKLTKQIAAWEQQLAALKQARQAKQAAAADQAKLVHSLSGQQQVLAGMARRHQGYYAGVRFVLNHPDSFPGILGAIGDLLRFDSRYEAALKTALGSGVQDLVAQNRFAARDAIQELKRQRGGRASFLPLDNLHSRKVSAPTRVFLQGAVGFIGLANQLVTVDRSSLQPAVDYLLGSTVIVDTIQTATRLSQRIHAYRLVTLDGDIIRPGGLMTGGSRSGRDSSPLAVTAELTAVAAKLTAAKQKLPALEKATASLIAKTADLVDQIQSAQARLQTRRQDLAAAHADQQNLHHRLQSLEPSKQVRSSSSDKRQLSDLQTRSQALADLLTRQKNKIAKLSQKLTTAQAAQQDEQKQIAEQSAQLAVLQNKLINSQRYGEQLRAASDSEQTKLKQVQAKLSQAQSQKSASQASQSQAKQSLNQLKQRQQALSKRLDQINQELGALTPQLEQAQAEAEEQYEARREASSQQEALAVKVASLQEQLKQRLDQLQNKYHISFEAVDSKLKLPNTPANRQKLRQQINLHKKTIAELGPVNLDAIEEYKTVKQRRDFLQKQENDLLAGRANLQATMARLDQTVAKRFLASFKKIAASFANLFPVVFGGGHAKLKLTAPDHPLTTGIEVIAEPPGKKLQELSLLSGGERALTAITLLFAILAVKPVPFCILDEVEAALDDPNVDRFGKFLHRFAAQTQFIVITHRRGTMVQADQLTGVVMQESGVSTILSVSLQKLKDQVK